MAAERTGACGRLALAAALCVVLLDGGVPASAGTVGTVGTVGARQVEPSQAVSDIEPFDTPVVAVTSAGRVATLFYDQQSWYATSRAPGESVAWDPVQPLDVEPGGYALPLVTWPDGRLTLVFYAGRGGTSLVTMAADGTLGDAVPVPAGYPRVGLFTGAGAGLADGSIVLVGPSGSRPGTVQAATLAPDGGWTLSDALPARRSVVPGAWTGDGPGTRAIVLRPRTPRRAPTMSSVRLAPDGTWGRPEPVATETRGRFEGRAVSFGTDGRGAASLMWTETRGGAPRAVVTTRPAGGSWTTPRARRANRVTNRFSLMGPDGATTVVSTINAKAEDAGRVVVSTLSPRGAWVQRRSAYVGPFRSTFVTVTGGLDAEGDLLLQVPGRASTHYVDCPAAGGCTRAAAVRGAAPSFAVAADGAGYRVTANRRCDPARVCSRRVPPSAR